MICLLKENHVSRRLAAFLLFRMQLNNFSQTLISYEPPEWAKKLQNIPRKKVQLGHFYTPIHQWHLPGIPEGFEVYIKRDDMTGSSLSGNKVRKLEFLFGSALERGCRHVMTCGGMQSNHCRATAVAAAQLGLKAHLLLRASIQEASSGERGGNMFLNHLCDAEMYFVPKSAKESTELVPRMQLLSKHIKETTGAESSIIPVGGSNAIGLFGYLECFRELVSQQVLEKFDDVVFACGSGGTGEGLALGNFLTGSKLRIHGVAVCDNAKYFHDHANDIFRGVGFSENAEEILDIIQGYKGQGYGISTPQELAFLREVAAKTGIILDPTYTGKAVAGLLGEMKTNPGRFKGRRVLFLHTGGIFGSYDGRLESSLVTVDQNSRMWMDLNKPPFYH